MNWRLNDWHLGTCDFMRLSHQPTLMLALLFTRVTSVGRISWRVSRTFRRIGPDAVYVMFINMDKKVNSFINSGHFFVNSNSIPIPFFSIPIPSPIPGIESGIELNSHSIPELTPTLPVTMGGAALLYTDTNFSQGALIHVQFVVMLVPAVNGLAIQMTSDFFFQ